MGDIEWKGRGRKVTGLVRADFWFLPSMVLCVPFIYVDWFGFTLRYPLVGVPWAAYILGGIVYFLLRFRRRRPSGRRSAASTADAGNPDPEAAHRNSGTRFSVRQLNVLDWTGLLIPTIFVVGIVAILVSSSGSN
jgi:uncharacterized membrane protein